MAANAVLLGTLSIIQKSKDKLYLLKSYRNFLYKAFCLLLASLIILSFGKLKDYENSLTSVKEFVGNTPVTLTFKDNAATSGIVFLAHGFAGSTSFMRPIAVALAEAGYLTVRFDFLGHGRHPLPYSGDITTIEGATQKFVNQTNEILFHYLTKYDYSFSMIIGHSMASDIIVRSASLNPSIKSAVAISAYTDALKAKEPKNTLILNGQWEPQLRAKSLEILKNIGIDNPREGRFYGRANDNTIRKWLTDIEKVDKKIASFKESLKVNQDPDIKDRKGTQPAKYHTGLSKSTKAARDRQFKRQTKMADDNPAAYKPAPGDKNAKTKPSKYTRAVNKMFGEQDAADIAKMKIDREKERDKIKHDRMMDRARMKDTIAKNRES